MDPILDLLIPYLINIGAGLLTGKLLEKEQREFKEKLEKKASAMQAQDHRSLKEQLRLVGTETARLTAKTGNTPVENNMLMLLTDEVFQEDMAVWLTAWKPTERKQAETVLAEQMVKALKRGGAEEKQIKKFKAGYFDHIEKVVFSDPRLANWRLTLALHAAFERLDELEAAIQREGRETRQ
ncbi:MAG TPA: hypothetical protein VK469_03390, partial [Candidatus Kapabacteria bacterium]|nr:hypothetical protein [Candidatus Kapabacteria bacterium]